MNDKKFEKNNVVDTEKESKIDKLMINVERVITALQIGFLLTFTGGGVYAISKAKMSGEDIKLPKANTVDEDDFKFEDGELTVPTIHGKTLKIKLR